MTFKILDLFAGVGGLSYGFELIQDKSGKPLFELHRAVEIDKFACETLSANFGKEKVIKGDLTQKSVHDKVISECKGQVQIVTGGIPCQSFSLIGPRSGLGKKLEKYKNDQRDNLYKEFKKIVKEIEPKIIVIENVKGILSKKDSKGTLIINKIFADFERLGYNFKNEKTKEKYQVLNAANFGAPQKRERVLIIGIRKEWKQILVPFIEPTHQDSKVSEKGILPYVSLIEAIGDLPKIESKVTRTGLTKDKWNKIKLQNLNINSGQNKTKLNKNKFLKYKQTISEQGKEFFKFVRPNGYKYIDYHEARPQQMTDIELFKHMLPSETANEFQARKPELARKLIKYDLHTFKDKYRKQPISEPGTTIFAHLEKDGNRFIHPTQARTITPREAARMQTFPDKFIFCGPQGKKFRQIGNAVPPIMSYNIGKSIQKVFK